VHFFSCVGLKDEPALMKAEKLSKQKQFLMNKMGKATESVYIYICIFMYMYMYMYIYVYVYIHMSIYALYEYIWIHIDTYI